MWIHTVVQGDTLRGIAERYGTTTRELNQLNEFDRENILVPGLHVLVPGPPTGVQAYQVREGDTLAAIARRLGMPQDRLQGWTGLGAPGTAGLTAGETLWLPRPIAQNQRREAEANGYLLPEGTSSDANILRDFSGLTYVCVFSYQARADGSLQAPRDEQVFPAAQQTRIAPLMTMTNFDGNNFNPQLAHTVLSNGSIRRRLIDNVLGMLQSKGFRGVNVDFEHMQPADRPLYNQFIRDLGNAVRARGHSISIAMGPKTADDPQASWMGAFDYQTLGREVDFLMLMTYEWGWVGGPPMAIAPLDQVRAVLNYATSVIAPQKILMGMALYGYDWPLPYPSGRRASGISNNSAQNLAIAQQVPILWDSEAASPHFRYRASDGEEHEVWFEDALSALIKMQLVYDLNLRGISWWVLGQEFPQGYYLMTDTFEVKKL